MQKLPILTYLIHFCYLLQHSFTFYKSYLTIGLKTRLLISEISECGPIIGLFVGFSEYTSNKMLPGNM